MTQRAYWQRSFFTPDGNLHRYNMYRVWSMGETVVRAGTTYLVQPDGWRKLYENN